MPEPVLDIDALLAPIDGGAGADLREDALSTSPYRRLRDALANARDEERAAETSGEAEPPLPLAWREVKQIAAGCLAERSKDFEVAAWLAEALVRLDGLAGLHTGTLLLDGLLERWWEAGFPAAEGEGLEDRGSALGGLSGDSADGRLMQPLRRLPLFRRADSTPVGLHLWALAEDTAAIPKEGEANQKRRAARLKAGVPELDALQAEAKLDGAALRRTAIDARTTGRAWAALGERMDARFGSQAPNTRRVAEALARMVEVAERVLGPIAESAAAAAQPPEEEEQAVVAAEALPNGAVAPAAASAGPRPLRTREDAIRQLEDIAAFFKRTEPHSPLAYTLDHAVRRARLELPELLAEVLPDAAARKAMLSLLGIRAEEGA